MTGMLHHTAMAYLTPSALAELKRQVALAEECPACGYDPVLLVSDGVVEVLAQCAPGCRERPQLTVLEGGA